MPDKKKVLENVDNSTKTSFSKGEVKFMVNSVSSETSSKPTKLKKGDVYISQVGVKARPIVICRVLGDLVLGIPMSTTEDAMNLCTFDSRFFGSHFFGKQLVTSTYEYAMENFVGVFDNNPALNKAVKLMKEFYNEVL